MEKQTLSLYIDYITDVPTKLMVKLMLDFCLEMGFTNVQEPEYNIIG